MKEIWKDIKGFEGLYQVSNLGRVKSLKYMKSDKEMVLKSGKNKGGYSLVRLTASGKQYYLIHRLVAEAFIANSQNLPCVNHIDGDKSNNTVENLEWVSHKENTRHAFDTGLITRSIPIYCKELDMKFKSVKDCALYLGVAPSVIFYTLKKDGRKCLKKYSFSLI